MFWTVIYVAGGVTTAFYCWNLIEQYTLDQTKYNVDVLFNNSITLPNGRLCFELFDVGPLQYDPNPNDIGKKMVLTLELQKIFEESTGIASREEFLDQKQNWPQPLTFAGYLYVNFMTSYEAFGFSDGVIFTIETGNGDRSYGKASPF